MREFTKGLRIGMGIVVPILTLMVLSVTVLAQPIQQTFSQQNIRNISIPILPKDSSYSIELSENMSIRCIDLEKNLGLSAGSISSISKTDGVGIVITFSPNVSIDTSKIAIIEQVFNKATTNITAVSKSIN